MARSAAAGAEQAADVLAAFLRHRTGGTTEATQAGEEHGRPVEDVEPGGSQSADTVAADALHPGPTSTEPVTCPASAIASGTGAEMRSPHPDWLFHHLRIMGPADTMAAFRDAARGAGTIPWTLDLERMEEDWFHLLVRPDHRTLSLAGARTLAAQLRDAVERRHALAVARVGHSRACPFDLHALVPVPADVLRLGPDHPKTSDWLWQHWGTREALRHVAKDSAERKRASLPADEAAFDVSFWAADWTPWRALGRIRLDWPALRVDVQPVYDFG